MRAQPCFYTILACMGLSSWVSIAPAQQLPPPPTAGAALFESDAALYLHLIINQRPTGRVVKVHRQAHRFLMDRADLVGVQLPDWVVGEQIDVASLQGVQVQYDAARQQLTVHFPQDWLSAQYLDGTARRDGPVSALSSPGALINYNLYANKVRRGASRFSLWHDARVFGMGGTWRATGLVQQSRSQPYEWASNDGYVRFDTAWRYTDQDKMLVYEAGDFITRPLSWTSAVRLGGIQVSRDFSVRPDLLTYPIPAFSGSAAVPSSLDVFVNGARVGRYDVDPGPFTLTDIPYISGAGEATLVTQDVQGRRIVTTLPFYVTNELLQAGLSSFSAGVGALRRSYGLRSFDYGELAGSASGRLGLYNWLTAGAHIEASKSVRVAGVSSTLGLWQLGTMELAYQRSDSPRETGDAYSVAYQYRGQNINLGARYERRNAGFTTLADIGLPSVSLAARNSFQVSAGASLGEWGSVGLGYFDLDTHASQRKRLWNVSYHRPLSRNTYLSVMTSREAGGGWAGLVQVSLALGDGQGTISASTERSETGADSQRVLYSRSAPLAGGWGWNVGSRHTDGKSLYRQGDITRRGKAATVRTGLYGSGHDDVYFGELSGSVAVMDGRGFLTNEVDDTFVLVSTEGEPEVPVLYENQLVGVTDEQGYLLVPWGAAYYPGKYEIEPLELSVDIVTSQVERRVAVEAQSGYVLRFPLERTQSLTLTLVDGKGDVLPVGTVVLLGGEHRVLVGWEGFVYLNHIPEQTNLDVLRPDGQRCRIALHVPSGMVSRLDLGEVICH